MAREFCGPGIVRGTRWCRRRFRIGTSGGSQPTTLRTAFRFRRTPRLAATAGLGGSFTSVRSASDSGTSPVARQRRTPPQSTPALSPTALPASAPRTRRSPRPTARAAQRSAPSEAWPGSLNGSPPPHGRRYGGIDADCSCACSCACACRNTTVSWRCHATLAGASTPCRATLTRHRRSMPTPAQGFSTGGFSAVRSCRSSHRHRSASAIAAASIPFLRSATLTAQAGICAASGPYGSQRTASASSYKDAQPS